MSTFRRILPLALGALLACGGSSPPPAAPAPVPDETAQPVEPAEPAEPAEPPAPPAPPIAQAPAPVEPSGPPRAHVAKALGFLPEGTKVIAGLDVARLAPTPLGAKLIAEIGDGKLPESCNQLKATDFGNLVIGGGDGTIVAIADGKLVEKTAIACLADGQKARDRKLTSKKIKGHTVHHAEGEDGWYTWTKAKVAVAANDEAAITAVLDPKSKRVSGAVAELTKLADHGRAAWVVATTSAAEVAGMGLPMHGGATGNIMLRAWADVGDETQIDVVLTFDSADQAKAFEAQARGMLEPMRGNPDLEPIFARMQLGAHGNDVHVVVHLDAATMQKMMQ